jgi:phosphoribosylglycinamide formyltransferase-1
MKVAIFASGGGSNFQALLDRKKSGDLPVEFVLVVGNSSKAKAFDRARDSGIETLHISPSHFEEESKYTKTLLKALKDKGVELIVLAGYMKKIPSKLIEEFRNRIVNIHPALLPAFGGQGMYGMNVHKAVLDYGAKLTGITVHFVDEKYDHGAIIYQESVVVKDGDSAEDIAANVLKVEHNSLWRAVSAIAQGKISVESGRVVGEI